MNNHLSKDQLAMWIIGRCTPEEERHGRDCPVCSAELARFQAPIATFRRTIRDWSGTKAAPCLAEAAKDASSRRFPGAWQWGTAAVAVFVLAAAYHIQFEPGASKPAPAVIENLESENWQDDAALMDAIAIRLSRSIPQPMEPIFVLIPPAEIMSEGGPDETK